jgi:N6-adenosine-specific RNA methylase IME4
VNKKYQTILADPPWQMDFVKLKMRPNQVEMPYKMMSVNEICNLGIELRPLEDDNCNLFLWTTHTYLPDAFKVMESWGFKYHCCLTWDKTNGRPCWGFKRDTEFVLYGFRGKITVNQRGHFIHTLFTEKLTTHSTKPEIFYNILESNTPEPRLELFARNKRDGWDCWGNEVESDIKLGGNE